MLKIIHCKIQKTDNPNMSTSVSSQLFCGNKQVFNTCFGRGSRPGAERCGQLSSRRSAVQSLLLPITYKNTHTKILIQHVLTHFTFLIIISFYGVKYEGFIA